MKKLVLLLILMFTQASSIHAQDYCDNFEIVAIYDVPPTPITPGGNYFILLLTIKEDNPDNLDIYANLFVMGLFGDMISVPTGPSSTLPLLATDTLPYILKLSGEENNQDFPENFVGQLFIDHSTQPDCLVPYSNIATETKDISLESKLELFPNPFHNQFQVESQSIIKTIQIYNAQGSLLFTRNPISKTFEIDTPDLPQGYYIVNIEFTNGESIIRKLIKS